MKKIDFKKFIPHLIALAVFFAVTIAYFAPIFFEGKDLSQGDVTSYLGWGNDVREYARETGDYCYWSNAMFGGMPSNYAYPAPTNNIFKQMQHLLTGFLPFNTAGAFFVYMIGFYIFLLAIALGVDCLIASFAQGLIFNKERLKNSLIIGLTFGAFQGLMPFIGFFGTEYIHDFMHKETASEYSWSSFKNKWLPLLKRVTINLTSPVVKVSIFTFSIKIPSSTLIYTGNNSPIPGRLGDQSHPQ